MISLREGDEIEIRLEHIRLIGLLAVIKTCFATKKFFTFDLTCSIAFAHDEEANGTIKTFFEYGSEFSEPHF